MFCRMNFNNIELENLLFVEEIMKHPLFVILSFEGGFCSKYDYHHRPLLFS
jgi:hypothetical protein